MAPAAETTTFIVEPGNVTAERLELVSDEARHATKVLRVRVGERIRAIDGVGTAYDARVESVDRSSVIAVIELRSTENGEPVHPLTLYLGNIKSRNRLEVLTEKIVELGCTRLVLVECERSQRSGASIDRLRRIVRAATKQCGRSRFVEIVGPSSFADAMLLSDETRRFVCHERSPASTSLLSAVLAADPDSSMATGAATGIWVGPEGGFADAEVGSLLSRGALAVGLGPRRLRTETAAISAVGICAALSARSVTPVAISIAGQGTRQ